MYFLRTDAGDKFGKATDVSELIVANDANAYTYYNRTASKISIIPGDWAAVSSVDILFDSDGDGYDDATFFLAFTVDGDVTDFVTFSTRREI